MRFLFLILLVGTSQAATAPLDRAVPAVRFDGANLPVALRTLARTAAVSIAVEPGVTAKVSAELPPGTLRQTLDAIVGPLGLWFEEANGGIVVRRLKTVLYAIDYPQLVRSGSGSASITLAGMSNTANGGSGTSAAGQAFGGNGSGIASDATQISVSQENSNTFWTSLEAELKTMLREGDGLVVNRFSGTVQLTAPVDRQDVVRRFLEFVNRRITQQVEVDVRLVEVTLHDERKLGVDWDLASVALGGATTLAAKSPVDVAGIGGHVLSGGTFSANLGFGQASAMITALKQQGDLKTVAQPRLRALNNQTSFVRVGEDRPFFRLQQSTTFNQGGNTGPFNQTQESFTVSTITTGTILAITPQIDANGVITLDVLPAITRLQAIVASPDGKQTAPLTEVKQASTIVRLRDGETAVIGGLISEETGESMRGVPILSAVPGVGAAFRSKAKLRSRTELVIFLTPRLVSL